MTSGSWPTRAGICWRIIQESSWSIQTYRIYHRRARFTICSFRSSEPCAVIALDLPSCPTTGCAAMTSLPKYCEFQDPSEGPAPTGRRRWVVVLRCSTHFNGPSLLSTLSHLSSPSRSTAFANTSGTSGPFPVPFQVPATLSTGHPPRVGSARLPSQCFSATASPAAIAPTATSATTLRDKGH